ncbi:MAG: recombinase family protein [Caldilineaceae bacterium]|nr:recombinase family protein [Caldilineaceae bacterium]
MKLGYARVSTHEQTGDLQVDALRQAGCEPDRIYVDAVSGASRGLKRPGLGAALAFC